MLLTALDQSVGRFEAMPAKFVGMQYSIRDVPRRCPEHLVYDRIGSDRVSPSTPLVLSDRRGTGEGSRSGGVPEKEAGPPGSGRRKQARRAPGDSRVMTAFCGTPPELQL